MIRIVLILGHYGKDSFSFSDNFLRMTFAVQETTIAKGGQIGGLKGGQKNSTINDLGQLTHRQKEVLKLIKSDNRISRSGISEVLHINESAIQKHLNNLKDAGFISRKGGTRGYWEISIPKK